MPNKPALHILWTMNCELPAKKAGQLGAPSWEASARSIEGFCDTVLSAGHAVTLFLSPRCAEEHGPLLEELAARGVELALHLHPAQLGDSRFAKHLGAYSGEDQRLLVEEAVDWFREAVGVRPRSFRPGDYSANDATYGVLFELGFRQGSVSSPGRDVPVQSAQWAKAVADPHYVDRDDRLRAGALPFLEVPVTTDPTRIERGVAADLLIEAGELDDHHRPIVERQLHRMAAEQTRFRTLCLVTHNRIAYYLAEDWRTQTLDRLLEYFDTLAEQYDLVPTTVVGAHSHWQTQNAV